MRHPHVQWVEHDLDSAAPLTVDVAGSVVICADVIEHVTDPSVLAAKLSMMLEAGALAVLISTPEREVAHGLWALGPPPNPSHVREWTIRELAAFLRRSGFGHGSIGLTRNNTGENLAATILAVYVPDEEHLRIAEDVLIDAPRAAPPSPAPATAARPGMRARLSARLRRGR